MKILYISDRHDGGILRHVRCLRQSLSHDVETFEIGLGGDEEFAGRSGHDLREWWQIRRVIRDFKPDVVHFHIPALFMVLYVRLFTRLPIVRSWHTPTGGKEYLKNKLIRLLVGSSCYYLPVSGRTWEGLRKRNPNIKGEVFYNPIRINRSFLRSGGGLGIIGLIGRFADQKDWSSFVDICNKIIGMNSATGKAELAEVAGLSHLKCLGVGVTEGEALAKFGEAAKIVDWQGPQPNGREWIGKMDVFVLTSKHEEMPTVVLEAFAERTAICGFIPEGGMSEILSFSTGPLKEVFIKNRDTSCLAEIVMSLLKDEAKRNAVIEDGWQILTNHFDAEKNCKGQLMDIYRRMTK